ncbi:MAG: hypothetical protein RLZZ628_1077 [Bacteroidota bacterium]|jgi:hypothetical protein
MYLAPINYDRFFERVFRDTSIAKGLLEDLLDVEIQEIKRLPRKAKLTDEAALVEFDYRCKMDGNYVIVDMQQWYKNDVVKRFYMYYCNNTSLQLEELEPVSITLATGKQYQTKNYHKVEPALTIIWMADDKLGFTEDIVSFAPLPEIIGDFVRDEHWWKTGDLKMLREQREKLLKILKNDTKKLSFLYKNRLIFVFQKNIIKNKKLSKYFRWFEFAAKTSNPDNKATDFDSYYDHPAIFAAMKRLMTSELTEDDFQYITDYQKYQIGVDNYNRKIRLEGRQEVLEEYEPIVLQLTQNVLEADKKAQEATLKVAQIEKEKERIEKEAKLKVEQTEKEAKLKVEQTEKEAKLKVEQTEKEAKLKVEQTEKEAKLLKKATELKLKQAQKEIQLKLFQQQLLLFKKMHQRSLTKEDIMSLMEIDEAMFQKCSKAMKKNKK